MKEVEKEKLRQIISRTDKNGNEKLDLLVDFIESPERVSVNAVVMRLESKVERLEEALSTIRDWDLPETGRFWDGDKTQPMRYEAAYGSNGARDYIRKIAMEALADKETA